MKRLNRKPISWKASSVMKMTAGSTLLTVHCCCVEDCSLKAKCIFAEPLNALPCGIPIRMTAKRITNWV
ncbi:hypothetical protein D3C71_2019220 [compost metagenome]